MAAVQPAVAVPPEEQIAAVERPEPPTPLVSRLEDGARRGPYETSYRTANGYCCDPYSSERRVIIRPS